MSHRGSEEELSKVDHEGKTLLHLAAARGHSAEVTRLVLLASSCGQPEWVNRPDSHGWAATHWAAANAHSEALQQLLTIGKANPNTASKSGRTALFVAAGCGHNEVASHLVKEDADCNVKCLDTGWSATHAAAAAGHAEMLKILLFEGKAEKNARDHRGETPLHVAAFGGHAEAVQVLLDAGAELTLTTADGCTPLHAAALFSGPGQGAVEALLCAGSHLDAENRFGLSPAAIASCFGRAEILLKIMRLAPEYELEKILRLPATAVGADDAIDIIKNVRDHAKQLNAPKTTENEESILPSDSELSTELHSAMVACGITQRRARYQSVLARVLQLVLTRRLDFGEFRTSELHMVGSFAEGWGSCLSRINGEIDDDSDIDLTHIFTDPAESFHIVAAGEVSVDCRSQSGAVQANHNVEYHDGHVTASGFASNPAMVYRRSSVRPAIDFVKAYRCCCYPRIEVLEPTHRSFIPATVLEDLRTVLKNSTGHLVAASPPGKDGQLLRLSTTFLERKLMQSLNKIQGQLFIIVKFLVKQVVSHRARGLKTYVVKNLIFYMLDETPACEWKQSSLVDLARNALHRLLRCLEDEPGSDKCMRHFFLRDAWLYLKKDHTGKEGIKDALKQVLSGLSQILQRYKRSLRPLVGSDSFQFHPFLILPILKPKPTAAARSPAATAGSEQQQLEFHEVYDAVRSALLTVGGRENFCLVDTLAGLNALPDCAVAARQSLAILAHLRHGQKEKAQEVAKCAVQRRDDQVMSFLPCLPNPSEHDVLQQLMNTQNSTWKFCFECSDYLSLDFVNKFFEQCFPSETVYNHWRYLNFQALLRSLSLDLGIVDPATAKMWFDEALEAEKLDVQELMTTLEFCRDRSLLMRLIRCHQRVIGSHRIACDRVQAIMMKDTNLFYQSVALTLKELQLTIPTRDKGACKARSEKI